MLRCGDYKYITFGKTFGKDYPSQLFDLKNDPDELNDLATKEYAAVVAQMDAQLQQRLGTDVQAIDREAVACDCASYKAFFYLTQEGMNQSFGRASKDAITGLMRRTGRQFGVVC